MSTATANQRWFTPIDVFARKLSLEDNDIPRGLFKNSIVIEPGTRACAVVVNQTPSLLQPACYPDRALSWLVEALGITNDIAPWLH